MKHVFRIGELASLYGIGTDTIRYYEEQGLIMPQRDKNDYRIYNIQDIWRMNVIRDLRAIGFSVERIREYLEDRSVESTLELLAEEKKEIEKNIAKLQALHKNVLLRMETISEASTRPIGIVEEKELPTRYCHQIEEHFSTDEEVDVLMKKLINHNPQRLYLIGNNQIGCRIPLSKVNDGKYRSYSSAVLIDPEGDICIPGGTYLRIRYRGASDLTAHFVPLMLKYAEEKKRSPIGDLFEFVWIDIHEAADSKEHITELQMQVE